MKNPIFKKCDYCAEGPCYKIIGLSGHDIGPHCQYSQHLQNWKQTDEYKIVKTELSQKNIESLLFHADLWEEYWKTKGSGVNADFNKSEHDRKSKQDFLELAVDPELSNQTPNCSICEWNGESEWKNGIGMTIKEPECCTAQAFQHVEKVYNSENCKALFSVAIKEKSDEKEPETPEEEKRNGIFHAVCNRCDIFDLRICRKCCYHTDNSWDSKNLHSLQSQKKEVEKS